MFSQLVDKQNVQKNKQKIIYLENLKPLLGFNFSQTHFGWEENKYVHFGIFGLP